MNKELLVIAACVAPEDRLLSDLKEAILNYQISKSQETKSKLMLFSQLTIIRLMTDGSIEEATKIMEKMKTLDRQEELFNPVKN